MELEFYQKKMEVELRNFMVICFIVLLSLSYCYAIGKNISKGINRLLCLFPIILLFVYLPFHLYSFHLNFFVFFSITWLGNSKLFLFAFDKGPLSSDPSIPFSVFLAVASLPIGLHQNPPKNNKPKNGFLLKYAIEVSLLAIMVYLAKDAKLYNQIEVLLYSTGLHTYLILDLSLTSISALFGSLSGLELEPNFKAPLLSTSLQNFWGRRWNLMASNILRLTIYDPTKRVFTRVLGHRWSTTLAVLATFTFSGLMHELMFYHYTHSKPTGEVTCFFILHGMCVAVEIELKKRKLIKKWRLPWLQWLILGPFMVVTSSWLLFAPLTRCKLFVRILYEYGAIVGHLF